MRGRNPIVLVVAVLCTLLGLAPIASASEHHHHKPHHSQGDADSSDGDTSTGDSSDGAPVVADPTSIPSGPSQAITIELTGYGAPDNTPAGSKTISMPVLHRQAGGTGTYADPITFASPGSAGSTEFPKGQRVYFPSLKRYGISEDSGATRMSIKHIDVYTGDGPRSVTDRCESDLTGRTQVIVDPASNLPVRVGPLSTPAGCAF